MEWRRVDDGSRSGYAELERLGEHIMGAGDTSACKPMDIHSVWNVGDDVIIPATVSDEDAKAKFGDFEKVLPYLRKTKLKD